MSDDPFLFAVGAPRLRPGRVRRGLEQDISYAKDQDVRLQAAGVAALRSLADQIDHLERALRSPKAGAYDRVPFTGLVRQFDDTYERVFAALRTQSDPIARALEDFLGAEVAATAADRDDPGPDLPQ